jgi:hypothetical protein
MTTRCILGLLVVLSLNSPPLCGQVDQEHWPAFINAGFNSTLVRQEFTPSLSALDTVQLSIGQSIVAPLTVSSGLAAVLIREGGANGPVIAESSSIHLPELFHGTPVFSFPKPVLVNPGGTYAFELVGFTPGAHWALGAGTSYAGGALYIQGISNVEYDLLFREGLGIPEPSVMSLGVLACAVLAIAKDFGFARRG